MPEKESMQDNRRQSVRVTGRNLFFFALVSPEKYEHVAADYANGISLYAQEGFDEIQMFVGAQNALDRIREKGNADLADFLHHLDNKVNMVLRKVSGGTSILDKLVMRELNFSGSGLAFYSKKPVQPKSTLEFHIVLLPAYSYIYCFGEVVKCEQEKSASDDIRYRVATKFKLIMEEDQEKLIQHTFKQQSLALRNRRKQG